jgi:hypothetical protein
LDLFHDFTGTILDYCIRNIWSIFDKEIDGISIRSMCYGISGGFKISKKYFIIRLVVPVNHPYRLEIEKAVRQINGSNPFTPSKKRVLFSITP